MAFAKLEKKKRTQPADVTTSIQNAQKARIKSASGLPGTGNSDPVYILSQGFCQTFDAVGKKRAEEMAGGESGDFRQAGEMSKRADNRQQSARSTESIVSGDGELEQKRRQHDFPEYSHSQERLRQSSFCDRFSSYAFRGGKLAGAVLSGQARTMFVSCVQRAKGLPAPANEKQRRILPNSKQAAMDGGTVGLEFNRDVNSAVGITIDAIHGATKAFEMFKRLTGGSGDKQDDPLEKRGIATMNRLYPFLKTDGDKELVEEYRAELKRLEGDNSRQAMELRKGLESALRKETAVLQRKTQQQRDFLSQMTRMQKNAAEAEKMFSSDGFADTIITELEQLAGDIPPDDERRGRKSLNLLSALSLAEAADERETEQDKQAEPKDKAKRKPDGQKETAAAKADG